MPCYNLLILKINRMQKPGREETDAFLFHYRNHSREISLRNRKPSLQTTWTIQVIFSRQERTNADHRNQSRPHPQHPHGYPTNRLSRSCRVYVVRGDGGSTFARRHDFLLFQDKKTGNKSAKAGWVRKKGTGFNAWHCLYHGTMWMERLLSAQPIRVPGGLPET